MSFSYYRRLAKTRLQDRHRRFYQGFIYNPAFRNYCQTHRLDPHNRGDQEKFLRTRRGWKLAQNLGLGLDKPVVQTIPYQKALIVEHGLDISPHLRNGHILDLRLDLAAPLSHLLAGLSFHMARYQRHVLGRGKRISPLMTGPAVLSSNREDKRYLEVEIDLNQGPDKIRHEIRRLISARPVRLSRQQRRRPYPSKITLWEVWNAYDKTKSFRRGAWSLGIKEDSFRKAYHRALALITGDRYQPQKNVPDVKPSNLCSNCPHRQTCIALCPEALSYVDQDYISQKEKLLSYPLE